MRFLIIAAISAVAAGTAAAADVYRTTGEDGETVYTDMPAADAGRVDLSVTSPAAAPEAEEAVPYEDLSPCEQARFIVRQYQEAEVLAVRNEDGSTRVLEDEEAAEALAKAQADEARLCKDTSDE